MNAGELAQTGFLIIKEAEIDDSFPIWKLMSIENYEKYFKNAIEIEKRKG